MRHVFCCGYLRMLCRFPMDGFIGPVIPMLKLFYFVSRVEFWAFFKVVGAFYAIELLGLHAI